MNIEYDNFLREVEAARPEFKEFFPQAVLALALTPSETRFFTFRECQVIISPEEAGWHLSISHPERLPTYEEMKLARYCLLPQIDYMGQIFPPAYEFVNVHPYCLHLYELA